MPNIARLLAPDADLCDCLRAGFVRDTRHESSQDPATEINRFPAMPWCGLTVMLQGQVILLDAQDQPIAQPLPSVFFSGPQDRPFANRNLGPVHAFCLGFRPHALGLLAGIQLERLLNQHLPLQALLEYSSKRLDWQGLAASIRSADNDAERWRLAQAWLRPQWQAVTPQHKGLLAALTGQLRHLSVKACAQMLGYNDRTLTRRTQAFTGLAPRKLKCWMQAEQALLEVMDSRDSLAQIAAKHGFADQAHLCRQARKLTSQSPGALRRETQQSQDPSLWPLRLRD